MIKASSKVTENIFRFFCDALCLWLNLSLSVFSQMLRCINNCGRQEEPAILISRLYVASRPLDFHKEGMEYTYTKRNVITHMTFYHLNLITWVLTICHMKLTQSTVLEQKRLNLWSLSPPLPIFWLLNMWLLYRLELTFFDITSQCYWEAQRSSNIIFRSIVLYLFEGVNRWPISNELKLFSPGFSVFFFQS